MIANVNLDFSEIHFQCVHRLNEILIVKIQNNVHAVQLLLVQLDIDV